MRTVYTNKLKDANGNAFIFSDTFKEGTNGNVFGNSDLTADATNGYELFLGSDRAGADANVAGVWALGTSADSSSIKYVAIPLDANNLTLTGTDIDDDFVDRILVGDFLVSSAGGGAAAPNKAYKISKIILSYNGI